MKHFKLLIMFWLCGSTAACSTDESGGDESAQGEPAVTAADTKPDVPLRNTYWKLVELNGGPVQPGEGKELHMIIKGDDRVAGYSGCNQFMGSVTVSGDGLSFGPVAGTRRMCQGVMEQESAFLLALESAHRHSISGEDLEIADANGTVVMRCIAVYLQ
jgi:putative lipoprotein